MSFNWSIAGKLFGTRDPGTFVKRRIAAIRWPFTVALREIERFGNPPSAIRPMVVIPVKVSDLGHQNLETGDGDFVPMAFSVVEKAGARVGFGGSEYVLGIPLNVTLIVGNEQINFTGSLGNVCGYDLFNFTEIPVFVSVPFGDYFLAAISSDGGSDSGVFSSTPFGEHQQVVVVEDIGSDEAAFMSAPFGDFTLIVVPADAGTELSTLVSKPFGEDLQVVFGPSPHTDLFGNFSSVPFGVYVAA